MKDEGERKVAPPQKCETCKGECSCKKEAEKSAAYADPYGYKSYTGVIEKTASAKPLDIIANLRGLHAR